MIIKGVFTKYKKWNPVHPTSGAFWGMGVGFGCGVGWGPGFGPEVIGYVGAGCGVGFSVGITLIGFGIGLPTNSLLQLPCDGVLHRSLESKSDQWYCPAAFTATIDGALELARASRLLSLAPLPKDTSGKLSSFKQSNFLENGCGLFDINGIVSAHTKSVSKHLEELGKRFSRPP
ncbi:hypothetical protein ACFE04_029771 [Oxalis oulophora]